MAKRDVLDGLRPRTPGLEKAIALWERQSAELVGEASQIQAKLDWLEGGVDVGAGPSGGPEYDPIPSRRPAGSEAAARYGQADSGRAAYRAAQEDFKAAREAWLRAPSRGDHTPEAKAMHRAGERAQRAFDASRALKGATAGLAGLGATGLAKVAAAKSLGAMGGPIEYALDPESRTPTQFLRSQEEFITGLPGLVSPSELPPPAVLPPDRLEAVEATHGMTGIAPDPETPNVTVQEVRAYVKNRVAKGDKLPKWAESITSMKNGRLVIKPLNPRSKARQEAAKPQNPRMGGPKRKHGTY